MEYVRRIISQGQAEADTVTEWTQHEIDAHRGRIGEYIGELRPRKRFRRDDSSSARPSAAPPAASNSRTTSSRLLPTPSTQPNRELRRSPDRDAPRPTASPTLLGSWIEARDASSAKGDGLVLDTATAAPSPSVVSDDLFASFTAAQEPTTASAKPAVTAVTVTQSPSAAPAQSQGISSTTEAIIIAASIAGVIALISAIVLVSVCYKRKKRRSLQGHPLTAVPNRSTSTSTVHSDGWRSESSELEKQALIRGQSASRSPSPASRGQQAGYQQNSGHSQTRSVAGNFNPRLPPVPESPLPLSADQQQQPTLPRLGPNRAGAPDNLDFQSHDPSRLHPDEDYAVGPLSPLRPPPLRLTSRRGSEAPIGTALLPSPRNPFSAIRRSFFSSSPNNNSNGTGDNRWQGAVSRSRRSSAGYDEERGLAEHRRTVESDTLPKPSGYRDSLWSVAASSWGGASSKWKSTYSDWNAIPGSGALGHSRSTSSGSRGGHSRGTSTIDTNLIAETASSVDGRRHSSVYSNRRPSEALIPALPPMPSAEQLQQQYGHKASSSSGSSSDADAENVQFKGRLHSVDFWAREEREMRLGTFEPAELEGSPTPTQMQHRIIGTGTPRDSRGEIVGAAMPGTPGKGFLPQQPQETMSRGRLGADPYANGNLPGPGNYGVTGGMQGGYSVSVTGGNTPPMPQGYTQESSDGSSRRLWSRARSRSTSRGRSSASTVATVFKQHPGEMVMI